MLKLNEYKESLLHVILDSMDEGMCFKIVETVNFPNLKLIKSNAKVPESFLNTSFLYIRRGEDLFKYTHVEGISDISAKLCKDASEYTKVLEENGEIKYYTIGEKVNIDRTSEETLGKILDMILSGDYLLYEEKITQ